MTKYRFILLMLLIPHIFMGCGSSISVYDQHAYIQATSLKVDALVLIDKAVEDAELHDEAIIQLQINIEKAYEYEKGREKNEISALMWSYLKDPNRNLLGGFIKRWRHEKILKRIFIAEAKEFIGKSFDLIAELESGKIKPGEAEINFQKIFLNN